MNRFLVLVSIAALWLTGVGCNQESSTKAEAQKAEVQKVEEKKTAENKVVENKVEPKKAEEPKSDEKKTEDKKTDEKKPEPSSAKVAPEAEKVLTAWYAAIAATKTLQCDTQAAFTVTQNGMPVQADSESYSFAAERPNKLALKSKKADGSTLISNGEKLYRLDAKKGMYTLGAAPASFSELDKSLVLVSFNQQQGLSIVGDALAGTALEKILANYGGIEYVGAEEVEGAKRHHLRVVDDGVHTDWWFSTDPAPHLLSVVPNVSEIAAKNGRKLPPGIELSLKVSFDHWAYGAAASADTFKIDPPSDATLVDDLEAPAAMTLVGKPAPAFEGKNLKGETVKLADLAGKIVVVDFWATWCPPCVAGLPKLAEMTAKHKADGVVFVAVNLQEEESIVKEFLALKKLDLNVVLDTDNKIMQKYKVEPVPQTVFIDRKGVVQVVHIGIGDIEEIPKQLEELIAGKDLATAGKKK
ncbi:MAG: redoxin domain-containing protein [Planctomycetia bacterium]|nr:redoxin domain-containing protein [Planctomycetia bacterium]